MKKFTSLILCLTMLCCMSTVAVADSIPELNYPPLITVKKSDPENVIKDGIIGNCE